MEERSLVAYKRNNPYAGYLTRRVLLGKLHDRKPEPATCYRQGLCIGCVCSFYGDDLAVNRTRSTESIDSYRIELAGRGLLCWIPMLDGINGIVPQAGGAIKE